jgi:hypothetical protein
MSAPDHSELLKNIEARRSNLFKQLAETRRDHRVVSAAIAKTSPAPAPVQKKGATKPPAPKKAKK